MKIIIYAEGGGDGKNLKSAMRRAFQAFFKKAGFTGELPKVRPCGGRQAAYDDFCVALANIKDGEFPILLVDSEAAISPNSNPWNHLHRRDKWDKPQGATDNHVHLMTLMMETWFLADKDALAAYFGPGFNDQALPNQSIESIAKLDVLSGLDNAAKNTPKRGYGKGKHAFEILEKIHPDRVQDKAPWACRLFKTLDNVRHQSTNRTCSEPPIP